MHFRAWVVIAKARYVSVEVNGLVEDACKDSKWK